MAMGEAAGTAAAMAIAGGVSPADVDVGALQRDLLAHGAYLRDTPVPAAEPVRA
jgi:hypothetical protein